MNSWDSDFSMTDIYICIGVIVLLIATIGLFKYYSNPENQKEYQTACKNVCPHIDTEWFQLTEDVCCDCNAGVVGWKGHCSRGD